jgi:ABC-type multidrug transport system ATPase subunit
LTEAGIHSVGGPPSSQSTHSQSQAGDAQPAVVLQGVSKLFGRFAALHDLTATLTRGRLYVLLGENGAGKTTLLRIIAGLASATRGAVQVLGSTELRANGARIGYMGHATLLYDELSARENLQYFCGLYFGRSTTNIDQLLDAVGLGKIDPKRRIGQYSQGMKQRLALARALLSSPDLLLLDEPFSNVDARSIAAMALLLGQVRDRGATVIAITHQAEALAAVADEWITLHAGTIVERRTAKDAAPGDGRAHL